MKKIELSLLGTTTILLYPTYKVVLTMDENGKHASLEIDDYDSYPEDFKKSYEKLVPVELSKRVMKAFTEHAIDKILTKDEIPSDKGMILLDGTSYTIVISKGDMTKEYDADDISIETYPLLSYLASWYRREMHMRV